MTFDNSLPEGNILVPVWSDSGVVKPLVDDEGKIGIYGAVTLSDQEVHLYYWDGNSWQKWLGNPVSVESRLYYWDGNSWEKWESIISEVPALLYYWDGNSWQKWLGNPGVIDTHNLIHNGSSWINQTTKWTLEGDYYVTAYNLSTSSSTTTIDTIVIPPGKLVKLKEISLLHTSNTINLVRLHPNANGSGDIIEDTTSVVKGVNTRMHMEIVLPAGEKFRTLWYTCTNGDVVQVRLFGELYQKE